MPFKARPGEDVVHVVAAHSGLMWDLPDGGKPGDRVETYLGDGRPDQRWTIMRHPDQPPTGEVSFLTVTTDGTRVALDAGPTPQPGSVLRVAAPTFAGQQRFLIRQIPNGDNRLVHVPSGLTLDVEGAGGPGAPLILWQAIEADGNVPGNQRFRFARTV